MCLIEVPILTIIVPLPSYWLTIIFDQDMTRPTHIPIKSLHNRRLLELFSELFLSDEKLLIGEYGE
jgi:hypothetical protein